MITPFPNSKNTKAFTGCHPVKAFYVRILWAGGFRRLRRPGSIVRVLRTERWVRPTERAGSEGSFICRCLGQRKPYNRPGGRGNAFPLWCLTAPLSPRGAVGLWVLSHGVMSLQESVETYSAPCIGGSPAQPG